MPTKTRAALDRDLAYYPFELIGAKVVWEHHYMHVKGILEAKIDRGETIEYVQPQSTMHIHEIFYETPTFANSDIVSVDSDVKNPYAPYLKDAWVR